MAWTLDGELFSEGAYSANFRRRALPAEISRQPKNLLLWSTDFTQSAWPSLGSATKTVDSVVAGATANSGMRQPITGTAQRYTFSCKFKAGTASRVTFGIFNDSAFKAATLTIVSGPGTATSASNLHNIAGLSASEETEVSFTLDANAVAGPVQINLYPGALLNGSGQTIGDRVYIYEAQLVAGTSRADYEPTYGQLPPYFDRNSDGTDISTSGVLSTKGTDVPCFDGTDGLILEAAATNIYANSRCAGAVSGTPGTQPTGWVWGTSTGTTLTVVPSRFVGANALRIQTTTGGRGRTCPVSVSVSTGAYTFSFLLDVNSPDGIRLDAAVGVTLGTATGAVTLYRANGVTLAGSTVLAIGTYVVEYVFTFSGAGTASMYVGTGVAGNVPYFTDVTVDLMQWEAGLFRTSYVPTTTSGAVTRAAAYIGSVPLNELGLLEKTNDYSFHIGYKVPHSSAIGPNDTILSLHDSTDAEYLNVVMSSTAGRVELVKVSSEGNYTLNLSSLTFAAGDILNIRGTINATEMRLYVGASSANSVTQGTDTNAKNGFALDISEAVLGTNQALSTSAGANGAFPGFTLYDYALDDSTLAALSADAFKYPAPGGNNKLVSVGRLMGR